MTHRRIALLAVATAALAAACSSSRGSPTVSSVVPQHASRDHGSQSKISHVIVIIQENRSFDDFFAGYPGANAPMTGCGKPTPSPKDGAEPSASDVARPVSTGPPPSCPPGDIAIPLHKVTFQNNPDMRHDWDSSLTGWDNGNMDGWTAYGKTNGWWEGYVYEDRAQVKPYWTMAQRYVLADAMFPTEFGGSFTGHLTLVAGTDDIKLPGRAEVNFPDGAPDDCDAPPGTQSSYVAERPYRKLHLFQGGFPCFDQFNTIAEVLDDAGVSWKYYATSVLDAGIWEPFEGIKYVRYGPDWKHDIIAPQNKVLKDADSGNLALVTWVTPNKGDSDHPSALSDRGPSWVTSVVNAIGESAYWANSAIIVVWDDWGGSYDNAAPPQLDYRGLGIRVPCLIISPYAKQGYVAHTQYEWGSILRFIEEVNGIAAGSIGSTAQGYTDGRATSLDDAFDFAQSPHKFVKIHSKYPAASFLHEAPSNDAVDTE